jgi:hypothetical protein
MHQWRGSKILLLSVFSSRSNDSAQSAYPELVLILISRLDSMDLESVGTKRRRRSVNGCTRKSQRIAENTMRAPLADLTNISSFSSTLSTRKSPHDIGPRSEKNANPRDGTRSLSTFKNSSPPNSLANLNGIHPSLHDPDSLNASTVMDISDDTYLSVSMYINDSISAAAEGDITKCDDANLNEDFMREWDQSLRENELSFEEEKRKAGPLEHIQKDITKGMRAILVDWMVEVAEEYKLSTQTLHLSVHYLDRYLSMKSVTRNTLQLVGVCALLLASKYEEIFPPCIDDFVYICDNAYTRQEILLMEQEMLNTLGFRLTVATRINFVRRFIDVSGQSHPQLNALADYLAELTLQEYSFYWNYPPSLLAAAVVCLALHTLGLCCWNKPLERYSMYMKQDLDACLKDLYRCYHSAPTMQLKAIVEKYSQVKCGRVADTRIISPPKTLP